jgi:hypothetical protein
VRWGGNATSRYSWQTHTYNAANDWYFEDFTISGLNDGTDSDSTQFIQDVKAHGSKADPNNADAGNGVQPGSNCDSNPVYIAADPTDANVELQRTKKQAK